MALLMATWGALGLAMAGIGWLVLGLLPGRKQQADDPFTAFWFGWALLVALLQLWHSVLPVDGWALLAAVSIGALGLAREGRAPWSVLGVAVRARPWVIVLLLTAAAWMANRAPGLPLNPDSGGYHVPSVRWAAEHPLVPGLGNLFFRLAYNSAYFLYVALLDWGPWAGRFHHVANGLMLLVLVCQALLAALQLLARQPPSAAPDLFHALLLPVLVKQALGPNVSSPSPDGAIFALGIATCGQLVRLLGEDEGVAAQRRRAIVVMALSLVGVTVKLSFLGLGGAAFALALGAARGTAWPAAACVLLTLVPWMARGVVLSGYFVFPATTVSLPVEWRLPAEIVVEERRWIRSWARAPGAHWTVVLGGWEWVRPWLGGLVRHRLEVVVPVVITVAAALGSLFDRRRSRSDRRPIGRLTLALVPPAVGLVFWFWTAPDLRFAGASLWLLAAVSMTIALVGGPGAEPGRHRLGAGLAFSVAALVVIANLWRGTFVASPGREGFPPIPHVRTRPFVTETGLVLTMPEAGGDCWDAPPPCAPHPIRQLRLRRAGDLRSGFVVER